MNLIKYRVWCTTDSKHEYVWLEEGQAAPSVCPENTAHSIDVAQNTIFQKILQDEIISKQIPAEGGPSLVIFGHKFTAPPNTTTTSYKLIDFDCKIRFATLDCEKERGNKFNVYLQAPDGLGGFVDAHHYLRDYYTTGLQVQEFKNEALTINNLNGFRFKIEYTNYNLIDSHDVIVNAWGAWGG